MSFNGRALCAALAALAIARIAAAAELPAGTLTLDPSKTLIEFRLPGTLHTTHGTFKLERGIIKANARSGVASGMIEVDAASGDSGLAARDSRMKEGILEAQKYPTIVFNPRHVAGELDPNGDFHAAVEGLITLHGSQHQVVIDADGHVTGYQLTATCHFSIPYVEWGMKDPSLLFLTVAKQVDIDIATAGHVVWATKSGQNVGLFDAPEPARRGFEGTDVIHLRADP